MISSKEFLESAAGKRLPEWMRNNPALTNNNKLKKIFPSLGLKNEVVKDFTTINGVSHSLIFSSDNVRGLWDIATMSMRGVSSCMHWENPHSVHVIGSVIDPCAAIAYLTDGKKTSHGLSIIKRVFVRLIFTGNENLTDPGGYPVPGNKPTIYVDRLYTKTANTNPRVYENKEAHPLPIMKVFTDYIKSKTDLPVFDAYNNQRYGSWFIPRHKIIDQLTNPNQLSFVDSQIPYKSTPESIKYLSDHNV
jgi:hypothetical protein